MASFRSVESRRRRAMPVITSTFENVSEHRRMPILCLEERVVLGIWDGAKVIAGTEVTLGETNLGLVRMS